MKKNHSPNCNCYDCTSGDNYIAHIRNQFGKNAAHFDSALSGGHQYGFNQYDSHYNDLSIATVKTTTLQPVANTPPIIPPKANLKQILGDALGGVVTDLTKAKKAGEQLPPLLDKVANLGLEIEKVAKNVGEKEGKSLLGEKIIQFSPYIVGGVLLLILLVVFLVGRKG